jgi:hypothetical protein
VSRQYKGQFLLAHFFVADADPLKQPNFGCLNQSHANASF